MGNNLRRRRSRKSGNAAVYWIGGICLFLAVGGIVTWAVVKKSGKGKGNPTTLAQSGSSSDPGSASGELKQALEETERKDPKWRLEDIAAARQPLDASKNGAGIAQRVGQQVPPNLRGSLENFNYRRDPSQPIPEFEVQQLRAALQNYGQAVGEARKLAYYPQGQYALQFNFKSPMDTSLDHARLTRSAAYLLMYDSQLQGANRDGRGAMLSAFAALNASRYHADEPFVLSQLVRIATRTLALAALERAMTCANVPDDALAAMQQALEGEGNAAPFWFGLRGQRATVAAMAFNVAKGEASWSGDDAGVSLSDDDLAWFIRRMNQALDLAGRPFGPNRAAWKALSDEVARGPEMARRVLPNLDKLRVSFDRSTADVRAAAIALAAERYRRVNGDWPADLQQLVPNYMKALPVDPFSGGAFHYSRQPLGITVYSLGVTPLDHKGAFNTIGFKENENYGFRLLGPAVRR